MKCFAFVSCWKILIHCMRKFKRNIVVLVTIDWLRMREFLVNTGKVYIVHQSEDTEVRICWQPLGRNSPL